MTVHCESPKPRPGSWCGLVLAGVKGGRVSMNGLTIALLSRACRTFLTLAYPEGESSIPQNRRCFFAISANDTLERFLEMENVCEKLLTPEGTIRGWAIRLGSSRFPHLKLQIVCQGGGAPCIFAVDTHDGLRRSATPSEAAGW